MSATPANPPVWTHHDSDPEGSLLQAFATADQSAWAQLTTEGRVRAFRNILASTAYVLEELSMQPPPASTEAGPKRLLTNVSARRYPTAEHLRAATLIARGPMLVPDPGKHTVYSAVTTDGQPAALGRPSIEETGAIPPILVGGVAVVGIVAVGIAICYGAQLAAEVIDRKLLREAQTERMIATQARAVALVDTHAQRELQAGKTLPWTAEELRVLAALEDTQRQLAGQQGTPLPNPFPGAASAIGKAVEGAASTFSLLPVALAVGGGLYLLSR
jgi:hypothetical protein